MGIFAYVGKDGIVSRVIVADLDFIESGVVGDPQMWVETSVDGSITKNYAGVGDTFDEVLHEFQKPKPFPSWAWDVKKAEWVPPVAQPQDEVEHDWDEKSLSWKTL